MPGIREEHLSDRFTKFYLELPAPFHAVVHRFTAPDDGWYHCHPFSIRSTILHNSYVEEIRNPRDGSSRIVHRRAGDSFSFPATHIHKIIDLPEGECWSIMIPGPHERTSREWDFRKDGSIYSRAWNEQYWKMADPRIRT